MSIPIGELLFEIRKEIGASAADICEGVCKLPTYSFYENGKRIPDFLTLNLFLERLGHGITGLAAYVTKEEMEYLEWRRGASRILREKKWEELKEHIRTEPQNCNSLNEGIRKQCSFFLQAVEKDNSENNIAGAVESCEKALRCTCPFLLKGELENKRIGKMEIFLYGLYLHLLGKQETSEKKEAAKRLENILKYVEEKITDAEEQVNIYPYLVCLWVELVEKDRFLQKKERYLEKAFDLLKKERKMYYATEVLRQLVDCKEARGKDCEKEKAAYKAICNVYQFFEKEEAFNPYELCENQWMFTIIGDYLEKNRRKKKLTQEKISDDVCAVETYSRIERGKRSPNQRNYKALTDKLGIEPRYMMELVNTGSGRAIILRKEIDEALFYGEYKKAKEILQELEILLKERGEEAKNRQYLELQSALCAYEMGEITREQREKELERILSYTLDIEEIGKNSHVYTRTEITIINPLSIGYEEYEKGSLLLKNFLKDMEEGVWNIEQRFRETYLAALNLDKFLTDMGNYREGNELCMKWGRMAVHRGWATLLDEYLLEISYNLRNIGGYTSDYTRRLCQTALEISEVYGTKESRTVIYNYLQSIL